MPVVVAVLMVFHIGCLLCGINEVVTEIATVCCGFYVVYCLSRALGFCGVHRALIYYAYSVMVCIWWERFGGGFGDMLTEARCVMFTLGLILLSYLLCCQGKRNC